MQELFLNLVTVSPNTAQFSPKINVLSELLQFYKINQKLSIPNLRYINFCQKMWYTIFMFWNNALKKGHFFNVRMDDYSRVCRDAGSF